MRVTFLEEIETKKAWTNRMTCPQCDEFKYTIHHQLQPETSECWWLKCENCDFESYPSPTRDIAIMRWKQARDKNETSN